MCKEGICESHIMHSNWCVSSVLKSIFCGSLDYVYGLCSSLNLRTITRDE